MKHSQLLFFSVLSLASIAFFCPSGWKAGRNGLLQDRRPRGPQSFKQRHQHGNQLPPAALRELSETHWSERDSRKRSNQSAAAKAKHRTCRRERTMKTRRGDKLVQRIWRLCRCSLGKCLADLTWTWGPMRHTLLWMKKREAQCGRRRFLKVIVA